MIVKALTIAKYSAILVSAAFTVLVALDHKDLIQAAVNDANLGHYGSWVIAGAISLALVLLYLPLPATDKNKTHTLASVIDLSLILFSCALFLHTDFSPWVLYVTLCLLFLFIILTVSHLFPIAPIVTGNLKSRT